MILQNLEHNFILQAWSFTSEESQSLTVLPDGCRDVIIKSIPERGWTCEVSELDDCAYHIQSTRGQTFTGFRLQPAACIDEQGLLKRIRAQPELSEQQIRQILPDHITLNEQLHEALSILAVSENITMTSRSIGVSERTLERLVQRTTARTPMFWKALARVRRCAQAMAVLDEPLAQLASDYGYADQAHMNREFKRWFGVTPSTFAKHPQLGETIKDIGYAC